MPKKSSRRRAARRRTAAAATKTKTLKKKRRPRSRPRAAGNTPRPAGHFPLADAHIAWLDSIAAAIAGVGGPRLSREEVLHALIDAAAARPIDPRQVKTVGDLRVAFGGLDLTTVERMLRERPRIEGGLLKALEDSIK